MRYSLELILVKISCNFYCFVGVFSTLQHCVRNMGKVIITQMSLLTVLQLTMCRHDKQCAGLVVSIAMLRNSLPSMLTTGLYGDGLSYLTANSFMPCDCVICNARLSLYTFA